MEFPAFVSALKAFYQDNDQPLRLKPKTTEADIAAAEQELGFEIDPALKAAWLAANGGPSYKPVFARQGYLTGYDFLPLQDALKQWRGLRTRAPRYAGYGQPTPRDPRIQDGWFQEGWLPFAGFSAPTLMLMLDHTPTAQGRPGQIIAFTHDPDSIDYVCVDLPTAGADAGADRGRSRGFPGRLNPCDGPCVRTARAAWTARACRA